MPLLYHSGTHGRMTPIRALSLSLILFCGAAGSSGASAACDGFEDPTTANAETLFDAISTCDSMPEAVFVLMIGQIRAIADMSLLSPKSEADEAAVTDLYRRLYYQLGGSGPDELYRNEALYDELVRRIQNWKPADPSGYSPGWEYSPVPGDGEYYRRIEETKATRLQQLSSYRALLSDDEYFELKRQADEILKRNDNTLVKGSADGDRYSELQRAMEQARLRIREERAR